ncbi:disulfide bond formation protein B [Rhodoferax sp.]|uniref:disulfide bond formation protein B n=1 Tax=Rhodoferax sp. TaxID=50421 RepID=UPI0025F0027C|nr:disulfide bond formation protein B [Rhodoferax sp.]
MLSAATPKPGLWALLFGAWLLATLAALGALFLSEVMDLAPCVLCWWQRVAMFPLVIILALALFPPDRGVIRYALPLAVIGLLVAGFHLLLMMGVIPEALAPCRQGIPCKTVQIEWFGFVTIPLLSFVTFLAITGLLWVAHLKSSE